MAINETLNPLSNFSVDKLIIVTNGGTEVTLKENFIEINMYESVFSAALYGDISVVEQFNFPSLGSIVGGEVLKLTLLNIFPSTDDSGGPQPQDYDYRFVIYAIENRSIIKQKSQLYKFKFCSKEAIWNQQIKICTTYYNMKYSEIAHNIHKSMKEEMEPFIKEKDQLNKFNFDEGASENKVTVHFPNVHPFEAFNFLAGRAEIKDKGNPYFFFESLSGDYHFYSWKKLEDKYNNNKGGKITDLGTDINTSGKNKSIVLNSSSSIFKSDGGKKEFYHDGPDYYTPSAFSFPKDFDFLENIKKGAYASQLIVFNNTKKEIKKYKFSQKELYTDYKHINEGLENALNKFEEGQSEYMSHFYDEGFARVVPANSSLFMNGKIDYYPEKVKNYRLLKLQELNNNFLTVNIPGSISIGCGKFTDIYLASPDTTNGINELKEDPHFGGTYFNLRVRHCFKVGGEYITSIEMSKDAFQDKTFQEKLKK